MADTTDEIAKIPGFMKAKSWNDGARLQEIWFAADPQDDPSKGPADTSTIRMDSWVLTFQRAKTVFDAMVSEKVWINTAAQTQIVAMLRRKGLLKTRSGNFGNLSAPAPTVHLDQINFRTVGTGMAVYLDPLDDMYAALGRFTLGVAVEGSFSVQAATVSVTLNRVGIYVRDSFDFNGDQSLGYWNFTSGEVMKVPFFGYEEVTNANYQEWRDRNKKGGDFFVYSDIKILTLKPAQSFTAKI